MPDRSAADRAIGEELADWGTVLLLETRGRTSGAPLTVAVGYVEEPDGSLLVAANDANSHWARNLLAAPLSCHQAGRIREEIARPVAVLVVCGDEQAAIGRFDVADRDGERRA